jgi:glycine cleavage system regulatory protein
MDVKWMQNGCKWNMKSYSFLSDEWSFRLLEIISRTSIDYMEAMMQRKLAPDLQSSWAKNDLKSFPHIFRFRGVIQKISYV